MLQILVVMKFVVCEVSSMQVGVIFIGCFG